MNECLTCKKHYTQGGRCDCNKRNCLHYEEEPRGRMVRTSVIIDIDTDPETPLLKLGEKIRFDDEGTIFEAVCIKINWLNLRTRECSISIDYHENEIPKFELVKKIKIVK